MSVAYRDFFADVLPDDVEPFRVMWAVEVLEAHGVFVVVDDEDGSLVGCAVARATGDLARVTVALTRWGEGIGQRLHDAAIAELRSHGHAAAGLWVIDRNERARRLYERNGWTLVDGEELVELGVREVRYRLDLGCVS